MSLWFSLGQTCSFQNSQALKCYPQYPPSAVLSVEEQKTITAEQQARINECLARARETEKVWDAEHKVYNGWKYAAITGFNLVILVLAIILPLADAVLMGIFIGTVVTAFGATVSYWDYARTKLGFVLMLVTFFVVLWIVNRQAKKLLQQKPKRK